MNREDQILEMVKRSLEIRDMHGELEWSESWFTDLDVKEFEVVDEDGERWIVSCRITVGQP